ncbi:uncharacterized protein TM35_000201720 [Trypanosoma theileri]|uniref:Transmembrane protein n=1 Tax=Trypanosoma theileri TaxID=67003 RepID=A0A1X0NTG4_9TRYP|nr:uncharacterized protein TM35_000201720 [Trypanosoma theileri]ORC87763.1 hypothetical protein TM35_000201720 [Trypanosoma theileri]
MAAVTVPAGEVDGEGNKDCDDVAAYARAMYSEACSIQKLLHECTEKTKMLEKDVTGFVQRDVAEDEALQKIMFGVLNAEMRALRNVRYVEFSQCHTEGENEGRSGQTTGCLSLSAKKTQVCPTDCFSLLCDGKPDAFLNLREYGDVCDVLLGWRPPKKAARVQFDLLCESILRSVPDPFSCVLFVNGFLYTPWGASDCSDFTETELDMMVGYDEGTRAEDILVRWFDAVLMRSLLSEDRLQLLWNSAGETEGNALGLLGDGYDTLTIVHHTRLQRSAVFRGFFFSGQLRGVESIGAHANLLSSLFGPYGANSQQEMERRIVDVFESLNEQIGNFLSVCKNVVVLLAVQIDGTAVTSSSTGDSSLLRFVVLDIRPLSPNLPFSWHFTWGEVCALGQLDTTNETEQHAMPLPVFKTVRVAVASLDPYDAYSDKMFPIINERIQGIRRRCKIAAAPVKSNSASATALVGAAVAATALVVVLAFAGRPLLGSRHSWLSTVGGVISHR